MELGIATHLIRNYNSKPVMPWPFVVFCRFAGYQGQVDINLVDNQQEEDEMHEGADTSSSCTTITATKKRTNSRAVSYTHLRAHET